MSIGLRADVAGGVGQFGEVAVVVVRRSRGAAEFIGDASDITEFVERGCFCVPQWICDACDVAEGVVGPRCP